MAELRIDPVCGRRVYIAEDRAGRPSDYRHSVSNLDDESSDRAARIASCPFCAGHEASTPEATAALLDEKGRWRVRVVPNKFPAVVLTAGDGPGAAVGAHEVIIESPEHAVDVLDLSVDELAAVLAAYCDRLRHWASDSRLRQAIVFKNSGFEAGASLEHVHSQLIALPYVPTAAQAEIDGATTFFRRQGRCVFCDLLTRTIADDTLLIAADGGFAAVSAYAARQPYETWVLPRRHAAGFEAMDQAELRKAADFLQNVLGRLASQFRLLERPLAYNLVLHTAPFDNSLAESYHWHWEIIPRTTHLAGFEWGAGEFINPVSPERAARELRVAT